MMGLYFLIKHVSWLLLISFTICFLASCKSRQVAREKSTVRSETNQEIEKSARTIKNDSVSDKSSEHKELTKQSDKKESVTISLMADSIVKTKDPNTGKEKTSIYPTKGQPVNITGSKEASESLQELINKQNDIQESKSEITESGSINKTKIKQDSTHKKADIVSKGSGELWPWVIGAIVSFALMLFFIYFKK